MNRAVAFVAITALSGVLLAGQAPMPPGPQPPASARLDVLKRGVVADVDGMRVMTQQMTDMVFSFGELGFQEIETSKDLTGVLEQHGFTIERGVAGIPTAWTARWGSGKPVIALGSDIDDIPQASQKPGVAYHDPIVAGAPGHGEGHNSGLPLQITAALALKRVMEREKLSGTLLLWPGVAEELLAGKAYLVRAGVFKDVDACIFAHVSDGMSVRWGEATGASGLVSIEYTFTGETAHAAGAPWRGRSALDAVELMNVGWNFRREHLRLPAALALRDHQRRRSAQRRARQRQRLVLPARDRLRADRRAARHRRSDGPGRRADDQHRGHVARDRQRLAAALQPADRRDDVHQHQDGRPAAVGRGRPDAGARAQKELGQPQNGLATEIAPLTGAVAATDNYGGGSDDIGDVSWTVPTVTIRYPSNIPGIQAHHWSAAIASATPIAHKGATAGAKVVAMTGLDLLLRADLVAQSWDYFRTVQTKSTTYQPLIAPTDMPDTTMNAKTMEQYRPALAKFYYDPTRYKTYLEQLGITYPTVKK